MWKFLFFASIVLVKVVFGAVDSRCCPPGHNVLITPEGEDNECVSPGYNVTTSIRKLPCEENQILTKNDLNFTVNGKGQLELYITDYQGPVPMLEPGRFCVADTSLGNNISVTIPVALVCEDEEEVLVDNSVLAICMLISVFFLALTAVIYIILPELRDLQGKSIISFCCSMSIGLAIMACMELVSYSDMNLCAARGFFAYFFILSAFFWTNAISIQILQSIYSSHPSLTDYGWREFMYYSLYAWGFPAVLTVCMAIVNYHPGNHAKPGIGLNHCWFFDVAQHWIYMYSVMSLLILVNICIFTYTSILLWKHTFASGHIKSMKYKFTLMLRLFILMGLPWVSEMISSLVAPNWFWVILDLFNVLQGPLIFLVLVVFRKKAIKAMYNKGYLRCIAGAVERHLAKADDDEENVAHTMVVPMEEK